MIPTAGVLAGCSSVTHAIPDLRLPSQPQTTATAPWPVLISRSAEGRRLS